MNKMHKIRDSIFWLAVVFMVWFTIFCIWEYMVRLRHCEERITQLEASARPLFVVDKYATVELNGEKLYPVQEDEKMLVEELKDNHETHETHEK